MRNGTNWEQKVMDKSQIHEVIETEKARFVCLEDLKGNARFFWFPKSLIKPMSISDDKLILSLPLLNENNEDATFTEFVYSSEIKRFIPLDDQQSTTNDLSVEMKWGDDKLIKEEKDAWEKREKDLFKPEHPEYLKKIEQSATEGREAFYE